MTLKTISYAHPMKRPKSLRPLLAFLTPFAYSYLILGAVVRVAIWSVFKTDARISERGLFSSLGVGLLNDAAQLVYIFTPMALLFALVSRRQLTKPLGTTLFALASFIGVASALFISIAEVLFWEEFESRFNLIAVDYLIYPTEVLGNIQESYPLPPILAGLVITTLIVWLPLWRIAKRKLRASLNELPDGRYRLRAAGVYTTMILPLALFFRSDTLSFSSNRAVNELSENGIATFFRAALSQEIDFHQFYKTLPSPKAFATVRSYYESLGERFSSSDPTSLVRRHEANMSGLGKLNIVILAQESLGAQFVGAYGDTRGLTPFLDSFSRESLMFKNAFATGTRTVRGLEAMAASFPPIPSESIVKRPGCENISTWGGVMRQHGYHTSFLYGGYGAFDNMNHFFGNNGFALSDRLDIPNPRFANIWGVSDEDLYSHAISYFDTLSHDDTKPFFSLIMSTSNHKPFTFREGVPGVPPSGGGRLAGIRYADFAISEFFRVAKTKPWFAKTIFIVMADHDSRVYGRAYVPVEHYRIPVFVYAPGLISPAVNEKVFSSLDLAPTILGLLGLEYSAPFYGVDVLNDRIPASRPVMFSHNHNIAWYEDEKLTVLGLQKQVKTFVYKDGKTTEIARDDVAGDLLAAHLQTAYELFKAHRY